MQKLVAFLLFALVFATELNYQVGESFHFDFDSTVGSMGNAEDVQTSSGANNQALRSSLHFSVIGKKADGWLFKMVMSDVHIYVQKDGSYQEVESSGDLQQPFADPFYFVLHKDGKVGFVAHKTQDHDDHIQFVMIKKGIVSTLQTLVNEHANYRAEIEEAIGVHYTDYEVMDDVVSHSFSQNDFSVFPDTSINPEKIRLSGGGQHEIRDGRIVRATKMQNVVFFSGDQQHDEADIVGRDDRAHFKLVLTASGNNVMDGFRHGTPVPTDELPESVDAFFDEHPELEIDSLVAAVPDHGKDAMMAEAEAEEANYNPYPYQRDANFHKWIGNKNIGLSFDARAFIGTNFDCNHTEINYKALARAQAKVWLFGDNHNVLLGKFEYGQEGERRLSDEILVTLWDRELYHKKLPSLPECERHHNQLFDKKGGFDVKKTVHIAIIPITFKATASAELLVDWDWELCSRSLSADVDIHPKVAVTISGGVDASIIIVRGGVSLSCSLNQAIRPEVYLKGAQCMVGFKIQREADPINVDFSGWYEWRHCHWFNCNWGGRKTHTFWQWGLPAVSETLYQKEWQIRKF